MAPTALSELYDASGYTPSKKLVELSLNQLSCPKDGGVHCHDPEWSSEQSAYIIRLRPEDIESIGEAIAQFKERELPIWALNRETFSLSDAVKDRLSLVRLAIHSDQGFGIIRGIVPSQYTDLDAVLAHVGLMTYIGGRRAMAGSEGGDHTVLHHITELPVPSESSTYYGPPNQTRDMPFHTDEGDIVSLFMKSRSEGQIGGALYLANATEAVNTLATHWPESLSILMENWTWINSRGPESRPIIYHEPGSGGVMLSCSRARLTGTQSRPRPAQLPALSGCQRTALDRLHASCQAHALKIDLRPGDILIFNNLRMLHARDAFIDDPNDPNDTKRHIIRLIVEDDTREHVLPEGLEERCRVLYGHDPSVERFPIMEELFTNKVSH